MILLGCRAALFAIAILLPACSAPGGAPSTSAPSFASRANAKNGSLYISSSSPAVGSVVVYGGEKMRYLHDIAGDMRFPRGMVINSLGQSVTANYGNDMVLVYKGTHFIRSLTKDVVDPAVLGVSPANDVYVMSRNYINIFKNAQEKGGYKKLHMQGRAVAFDSANNAYIASGTAVSVYPPSATKPKKTFKQGDLAPVAVAIDALGNLFVGNFVRSACGNITVYNIATGALENTITDGVCYPISFAFDSQNNVYVANNSGAVTVYNAGTYALKETISTGVSKPSAVLVDPSDNLYVANDTNPGSVTIYPPGETSPSQTLKRDITSPFALAWAP